MLANRHVITFRTALASRNSQDAAGQRHETSELPRHLPLTHWYCAEEVPMTDSPRSHRRTRLFHLSPYRLGYC
jgi:hypothetical protein